jgi:hypothetical protein
MQPQRVILLAAGLFAHTASAQLTPLGSVTFGTPTCGTDLSHPVIGFNTSDCAPAFEALLDAHCTSGVCTIPPSGPDTESGSAIAQTVRTCGAEVFFFTGTNGATFDEAPVQDAFPGFVAQCTTEGDDASGFPELKSTNGALALVFFLSESSE